MASPKLILKLLLGVVGLVLVLLGVMGLTANPCAGTFICVPSPFMLPIGAIAETVVGLILIVVAWKV